ncbi:S8 family serine peptidase [Brevibacillus humidisoli]|uniref:S8 family peptidase n=1 Tax=Brevibacillus humidisoli TaxID=2895522 RepID=UPI001E521674|nr:S8 family serine peptidase [Brevibacillus humidisoli]UFJ40071.1 S8 family serine peptidase [Brevibacillus humidisoli]
MERHLSLRKWLLGCIVFVLMVTGWPTANRVWAESPNDPYYRSQPHLKQIKADRAWSLVRGNTAIKIAVLDSGVDRNHPDLKDNLLPGINLLSPSRPPEDDNGHGTAVAGILAAKGNNGAGGSGVMWDARIIPIKVLDHRGEALVENLAHGINTAVDLGAKVILMSVSSIQHSAQLEQAVKRAEERGVVLVAAAGNESSRVTYPAGYPTVIAVGAVNEKNQVIYQSNTGPELNLVAPGWSIYTTQRGGGYWSFKGTSAAAPQVAAAAAMILSRHPHLTPLEVRQLLYHTATDLGSKGWDRQTGYGLLNVDAAVRRGLPADINEPNNSRPAAAAFPIESQVRGSLDHADTVDWYYTDIPYDGKLSASVWVSSYSVAPLAITFYNGDQTTSYYPSSGHTLHVPVEQGRVYIKVERGGGAGSLSYLLTSRFQIAADRYENNDQLDAARPLPPGNRVSILGNFHRAGDVDWFSYYVRGPGKLGVTVTSDTYRIDPVLFIAKEKERGVEIDNNSSVPNIEQANLDVTTGKYYVRLTDYWGNQVNGEYQLEVIYTPERQDENEPNDTYNRATNLGNSMLMTGTLATEHDYDWFQFVISEDTYATIRAPYIPVRSGVHFSLYKAGPTRNYLLASATNVAELSRAGSYIYAYKLTPGTYYVRLNSMVPFRYDAYRLTITRERLIDGYRDISNHWARAEIARLSKRGIVRGFEDSTFRPNQTVTRAEFATMLIRTMSEKGLYTGNVNVRNPFRDINRAHWAHENIIKAYSLGILAGYPDRTIRPNQPVTRSEMAVMVARAKGLYTYKRSRSSYRDVSVDYWASPAIESLTSLGYVRGISYRTFQPQAKTRRVEVVVLLTKAFNL